MDSLRSGSGSEAPHCATLLRNVAPVHSKSSANPHRLQTVVLPINWDEQF
jgi:hypothetical protein